MNKLGIVPRSLIAMLQEGCGTDATKMNDVAEELHELHELQKIKGKKIPVQLLLPPCPCAVVGR